MLRKQKTGSQNPWKLEEIRVGLEHFFTEHKRYPTASEIDVYPYLPSSRSIERRFNGLVSLRKQLNLKSQSDFRTGEHSRKRAFTINKRAHEKESIVYKFLVELFGKEFVHREYFFLDDARTRADFFIYDSDKGFCVDVFYPKDRRNLTGCLNSKLNKYKPELMQKYPVIFLVMNEALTQEELNKVVKNKKKTLSVNQSLMTWSAFREFCHERKPLRYVAQNI